MIDPSMSSPIIHQRSALIVLGMRFGTADRIGGREIGQGEWSVMRLSCFLHRVPEAVGRARASKRSAVVAFHTRQVTVIHCLSVSVQWAITVR